MLGNKYHLVFYKSKYEHLCKHLACVEVEMKLHEDIDLLPDVLGNLRKMVITKIVIQPYHAVKVLHDHFIHYPGKKPFKLKLLSSF